MPGMKWIEPSVVSNSSGNPIFGEIFGHQRTENEAGYTKMYRGQETHPIMVNARYEMNYANSFSKSSRNHIFGQIFDHKRARNEARNTKMNRGEETHPIRVYATYEMNWANSFYFKKFRKPCLQTDGRTDKRTDRHRGESSIPLFHLWCSWGIMMHWLWVYANIVLCTHNNARHNICTHWWHDEVLSLYSVGPSIWFMQPYSSGLLHLLPYVDITSKL